MKRGSFKIAIIMILLSICTCGLLSFNAQQKLIVKAADSTVESFLLVDTSGNRYTSTDAVGTVDGTGKFVLGSNEKTISATAKANYELVGWQVTYQEQELEPDVFKVEYFKSDGLDADGKKTITLTTANGTAVEAYLVFNTSNGYKNQGSFTLSRIFENLTVTPVFDHIYYQVDVSYLVNNYLIKLGNEEILPNGNKLYYAEKTETETILSEDIVAKTKEIEVETIYGNATIKNGSKYYFYGELNKVETKSLTEVGEPGETATTTDTKIFKTHLTQEATPREQKIDYTKNAFILGEEVNFKYNMNIVADEIFDEDGNRHEAKNVDLQSVVVKADSNTSLTRYDDSNVTEAWFKSNNDSFKRTKDVEVKFNVLENNNYINSIECGYHWLWFVDIALNVDGVDVTVFDETGADIYEDIRNDVLGTAVWTENKLESNIDVKNFYSCVSQDKLQFFAKKSADDINLRSFSISCAQKIQEEHSSVTYLYYELDSLNGNSADSIELGGISADFDNLIIEYSAAEYQVKFGCFEYVNAGSGVLTEIEAETLAPVTLKRGESVTVSNLDVQTIYNPGYSFKGFARNKNSAIIPTDTYTIDDETPSSTTIYLVYEKIDFKIEIDGFNKEEQLDGKNALVSATFKVIYGDEKTQTIASSDVVSNKVLLNDKIKLGGKIEISTTFNNGFNIVGYSLDNSYDTVEDCVSNFEITQDVIQNYLLNYAEYQLAVEEYTYIDLQKWEEDWNKVYVSDGAGGYDVNINEEYDENELYYILANWAKDYNKLYVSDGADGFILNTSETYDKNQTYYCKSNKEKLTIYVFEESIKYELTYLINKKYDNELDDDVIMSNISVELPGVDPAELSNYVTKYKIKTVDGIDEYEEMTDGDPSIVAKIVVSNLKYGKQVILYSESITVDSNPVDSNPVYTYAFNWFTEDGKSTLKLDEDPDPNDNKYAHTETIKKTRTIEVVYSMPRTQIALSVDEGLISGNFDFIITLIEKSTENVLLPENGLYSVQVNDEILMNISNLAMGYKFIGYKLNGGILQEKETEFEYKAISGNNFIELVFERINYQFNFYEEGGDRTGLSFSQDLTIDNSVVDFVKPEGYYVATVRFRKSGTYFDEFSSELSENNNFRNNADIMNYQLVLTSEKFKKIVSDYSYSAIVDEKPKVFVDVEIKYSIFKYKVTVNYGIANGKEGNIDRVQFPALELSYDHDGVGKSITKPYTNLSVDLTGIEYSAQNAKITILSGAPTGLEFSGWYLGAAYIDPSIHTNASNYIELGTIKSDFVLDYKLAYVSYYINVLYDNNKGNPNVNVNGNPVQIGGNNIQVALGDSISIEANAMADNGYKFSAFKYLQPFYREYDPEVDEAWDIAKEKLYVKSGNFYIKNASDTYDEQQIYYYYKSEEVRYEDSDIFSKYFNVADYFMTDNSVTFTIEYGLMEFMLKNTIGSIKSEGPVAIPNPVKGYISMGKNGGEIYLPVKDFLIYTVSARDIVQNIRPITESDIITFEDVITIRVELNTEIVDGKSGAVYDLSMGVKISKVLINDKVFTDLRKIGNGVYTLQFNIKKFKSASETVKVSYELAFESKSASVTTVVTNSVDFYKNIKLGINAFTYNFWMGPQTWEGDQEMNSVLLENNMLMFMSKMMITARLSNDYVNYFKISGVDIYCNGKEITSRTELERLGVVINHGDPGITTDDWGVEVRLLTKVEVVYKIQPILTFNGGPNYEKEFKCDENCNPIEQRLTVGSSKSSDIMVSEILKDCIVVTYKKQTGNTPETESVSTHGNYNVFVKFVGLENYEWVEELTIDDVLTLTIKKKNIILTYDEVLVAKNKIEKTYDGKSDFFVELIDDYLVFRDNSGWEIYYSELMKNNSTKLRLLDGASAYISSNGKDERISLANENVYYNIYVYGIALKQSDFNDNFVLQTEDLIIKNYIKILRRQLTISGIRVYDKVFDDTTNAELISQDDLMINNKVSGDDVVINFEKFKVTFEDKEVGTNKKIAIDVKNALGGNDVDNYFIENTEISGLTIYPYEITTEVKGVGKISLINKRGLTEKDKVTLIKLNSILNVEVVREDSPKYTEMHGKISRYLRGNNEFAIAYTLTMTVEGKTVPIDKDLYLSIPKVKNLTGAYFLTGDQTGSVATKNVDGKLEIDLSNVKVNINSFVFTQKKILLKPWQIVLIVTMGVLTISAVVLAVVIVRKRKNKEYGIHEKI